MPDRVKILIVDDTIQYCQLISDALAGIDGTEITGVASNGEIALAEIPASSPDLVLLDISMPVLDGLETLKILKERHPDIDVVMVSEIDHGNAGLTMRALNLGALDFIAKPQAVSYDKRKSLLMKSLGPIVSLVRNRKYFRMMRRHPESRSDRSFHTFFQGEGGFPRRSDAQAPKQRRAGRIRAVGIGVSTGGPNALLKIIPFLDRAIPVPVLTVQHMPPTFTSSLAERLNRDSRIAVEEAREGIPVEAGRMYLASGGHHLIVRNGAGMRPMLGVVDTAPVNSCCPSVDVLFHSMTSVYGGDILAVILTGMGKDGASGVSAIRRKGGYCIVQDENTSVVWGMPQTVAEAGDADEILPVDRIAGRIMDIVSEGKTRTESAGGR